MPAITLNLSRGALAPGWDPTLPGHDALWQEFAAGYAYRRLADPAPLHDSLRATDPATGGRSDTFDAAAGSLDLVAHNFAGAVSLDWADAGRTATLALDAVWGTVDNLAVSEFTGDRLVLRNWVDAYVALGGSQDRDIVVDGAKRAEVVTGGGDDSILVGIDSDGAAETNLVRINAGAGDDSITAALATQDYTGGAAYKPRWSRTEIKAGAGDDVIDGGPSADRIDGGTGYDTVRLDGARADYAVEIGAKGVTVRDLRDTNGQDGTDRLKNVEALLFDDAVMLLPQDGFGDLSPPVALGTALTDALPHLLQGFIDFGANPYDASDFSDLSNGAQSLLAAQPLADALSFDVLARIAGATLLKRASEIVYDTAGPTAEYLVSIDGVRIGVETVRAFAFPLGSAYAPAQATTVLTAKLEDINESNASVSAADRWEKQILHVFAVDGQAEDTLITAYDAIDAALKADTILLVTRTEGDDGFLYLG